MVLYYTLARRTRYVRGSLEGFQSPNIPDSMPDHLQHASLQGREEQYHTLARFFSVPRSSPPVYINDIAHYNTFFWYELEMDCQVHGSELSGT